MVKKHSVVNQCLCTHKHMLIYMFLVLILVCKHVNKLQESYHTAKTTAPLNEKFQRLIPFCVNIEHFYTVVSTIVTSLGQFSCGQQECSEM